MQFIRQKLLEVQQDANAELEMEDVDVLDGLDVLDVGCGGGLLSEVRSFCVTCACFYEYDDCPPWILTRMGANTLGIDASESKIAIASLHAPVDPN